jgi:hypothetical protein
MAQFKSYEAGIEIMGPNVLAPLEGMGSFRRMAESILADVGLDNVVADDKHWYPLQAYLDAFKSIAEKTGDATLLQIGKKVMSTAVLPPMNSIEEALGLMDIAYHMNYRNARGQVLFDPKRNPPMLEGIGHYKAELKPGEKKALMHCSSPFPCAYDRGIVTVFAQHYNSTAKVEHNSSTGCRKTKGDLCQYIVTWD